MLKPLQPDRGLPSPSKTLILKPRRRLCQEQEDHEITMFGKAVSPITHPQHIRGQRKLWSQHTRFEVLFQPHRHQDGKVGLMDAAPQVAGCSTSPLISCTVPTAASAGQLVYRTSLSDRAQQYPFLLHPSPRGASAA